MVRKTSLSSPEGAAPGRAKRFDGTTLTAPSGLDNEAFRTIEAVAKKHYPGVPTLPTMSTGATDMSFLRSKGMQCYGIGPMIDSEDGPKGYGAHSDQERILESSLQTFVKFHYDLVAEMARAQ